ncbi:MAG TPA: sulfotransferase [Acetobacteraceae bacterium]|nr:sulfotransferase [Acetobacteraceae bacterium]
MNDRITSRQVGVTPDNAFRQAVALQQQGDLLGAEKIYRAILKQYPKHFQTLSNLGTVLLVAERMEEAVPFLRKALNQDPNAPVVHTQLAWALGLLDRHEEALERAGRAIALHPELPGAHATLAQLLANLGRYAEAMGALGRAIELAPDQASYYCHWGHIARWTPDDPRLAGLEALAQKAASLPPSEQVALNFALAKADEDCGNIERAFRRQIEGGALQRRLFRYDEAATLRELDDLCRALDAGWMAGHQGAGDPSALPVFVLGMPRSGSTLVEQILASHPKVRALGERLIFVDALARICGTPTVPASLAQRAARWPDADLRRLGALYREAVRRAVPADTARIIDKLPANFRYAGLIHAALPNARIIHTRRDPVDTCLSVFSILFSGLAQLHSYDLGELGRYYRAYEKVMAHWRDVLPAGVMLEVQYEAVVDDLEGQARRIVSHCGLEWDDACLEFHKSNRPVRTISHAQVRQPIYRRAVGRQRPPRHLLLPLLEALGVD